MPSTTNFGWTTPADTDLVKDGASAIRTLANGIDTSLVDLKGGTTGQVLSKNSNTDLDFIWVAQDDSNAIQNAIVDAKGDLITATAADTPARIAVGANDTVLTADSTTATGLKWATPSGWNPNFQLLNSGGTSLSGSSTSISGISGKNALMVYFTGASTTNTGGYIRFTLNNDTSNDIYNYYQLGRITTTVSSNNGPNTFVNLGRLTTNDASTSVSGIFWIYGTNASGYKVISGTTYNTSTASASAAWSFTGYYAGTSTISSIQMVTDDTFDAGTVYVYGA